jgi:hypothetical protein
VQNTVDDGAIFSRAAMAGFGPYRRMQFLANMFAFLLWMVLAALLLLIVPGNPPYPVVIAAVLTVGLLALLVLHSHTARQMQNGMYDPKGLFLRPLDITVSSQGVSFKSDVAESKCDWRAFLRVEETPTHFFLYTDKLIAHIVPKRGFEDADHIDRFAAMLRANIKTTELSA